MTDKKRIQILREALQEIIAISWEPRKPDLQTRIQGIAASALGDASLGERPKGGK